MRVEGVVLRTVPEQVEGGERTPIDTATLAFDPTGCPVVGVTSRELV